VEHRFSGAFTIGVKLRLQRLLKNAKFHSRPKKVVFKFDMGVLSKFRGI